MNISWRELSIIRIITSTAAATTTTRSNYCYYVL